MANRYWVGGTGTWDTATTTQWSATSGGAGGASVPGAADVAIFDANSNVAGSGASYTVTKTATAPIQGLQMAKPSAVGATVTLAGTAAVTVGSAGLTLTSSAEVIWSLTGAFALSATTAVCTTGGAVIASAVTVSTGAVVTMSGNFSTSSTITCTSTGIINPNNFVCKCSNIALGATTGRTVAFGAAGAFELTGTATANYPSSFPASWTAITGTPLVVLSGAATTGTRTFSTAALGTAAAPCNLNVTAGSGSSVVTVTSGGFIKNLTFTGYTGTFTSVGGSYVTGNMSLASGMTLSGTTTLTGAAGVTQTITSNGVIHPSFTVSGTSTTAVSLADDLSVTGALTLTSGALVLNGFAVTSSTLVSSNSNTRSINFGTTGTITLNGAAATLLDMGTTTGITFSNVGTIYVSPSANTANGNGLSIGSGPTTLPNVYLSAGTKNIGIPTTNLWCNNFTADASFTGTVDGISGSGVVNALGNIDVGGAIIGSNFGIGSRPNTAGTYTLTLKGNTYYSFISVPTTTGVTTQLSGSPTFTASVGLYGAGATTTFDLQNNVITASNCAITIDATSSLTFAMGTGYLVQDNSTTRTVLTVVGGANLTVTGTRRIDLKASSTGTRTVSIAGMTSTNAFDVNVSRTGGAGASIGFGSSTVRNLDFTGMAGTLSMLSSNTLTVTGALTMGTGMTVSPLDATAILKLSSPSGSYAVTTNGVQMPQMTFGSSGDTATWTLQDTFTSKVVSTRLGLTLAGGTLNTNSQTMTIGSLDASSGNVSTLTLGASSITVNKSSGSKSWDCSTSSNLTVNSGTSTITFSNSATGVFNGGDKTWYNLVQASTNDLQISNNNTFNDIQNSASGATAIRFASGSTQTLTNFTATGASGSPLILNTITGSAPYTLSKSSGTVSVAYTTIRGSTATGGARWLAYLTNNNTNLGYNNGWLFSNGSAAAFFDVF